MVDKTIFLFSKMMENDCRPNEFTYSIILKLLVSEGQVARLDEIVELSRKYMNKSQYAYLVRTLSKLGHANEAHRRFCNIWNFHDYGDRDAYLAMLESLCNAEKITEALELLRKNGDVDEAHMRFREMQEKVFSPDVVTYSTLIECFGKSNKVEMACRLLDEMLAEGCCPNIVTYNILLDCLEKCGRTAEAVDLYA
ncbi:hypothetical protein AgCh_021768 [Apium graveolens]